MIKEKYFFIFLLFVINLISAQYTVKGKIADFNNQETISYVNVILKKFNDNTFLNGEITNDKGEFVFLNINEGKYILEISFIGFEKTSRTIEVNENLDIGIVFLKESLTTLDGVEIKASKPLIKREVDRLVFNIEASPLASSGSAWDAIMKSPSVSSDSQSNLRAFNKSASIMIDGRLQQLDPESLSDMLRGLSAENIIEIEIITVPPAKYAASGGALINIVTKKKRNNGYSASINSYYEQSKYSRQQIGLNFISKIKKLDFNFNYNYLDGAYRNLNDENIFYPENGNLWKSNNNTKTKKNSNVYTSSLYYNINKKNIIGIEISGFLQQNKSNQFVETEIFNSLEIPDSTLINQNTPKSKKTSNSINFNYNRKINKNGNFSLDFDYTKYNSKNNQDLKTNSLDVNENEKYFSISQIGSNQDVLIKSIKFDYTHKLGDHSRIEGGAKLSSIKTENRISFRDFIDNNFVNNDLRSNEFTYEEFNKAAYVSFNSKINKIEFKTGVRFEFTDNEGVSLNLEESNKQSYLQVFPVMSLLYNLTDDSTLDFEYNRGIARPGYWRLNPFRFYITPYSYLVGNPFLKPSISNSFAISYVHKNKYVFVSYYNKWKDDFTQITVQNPNDETLYYTQENLGRSEDFGLYFILPLKINSWWNSNIDLELSRKIDASNYINSNFRFTNNKFYITSNNIFSISKKKNWTAELSGWYNSSNLQGLFKSNSTFDVSVGMRKYFYSKKLSLSLAFSDIFWRNATRTFVDFENQNYNFLSRNSTQKIRFAISYKLNNKNHKKIKEREGIKEEKERLKN